jgi:predicted nucleic acid-binding protein
VNQPQMNQAPVDQAQVNPTMLAVDTSVAIPLLLKPHKMHNQVSAWAAGKELRLCGHALLETYSALTRMPVDYRVTAQEAVQAIDSRFAAALELRVDTFWETHRRLAARGVFGGATWDGLVALAALQHDAVLVTRDARALATYDALGVTTEVLRDDVQL